MNGEQLKTGNDPSGSKPLQPQGLGTEKENFSIYATSIVTISLGAEKYMLTYITLELWENI